MKVLGIETSCDDTGIAVLEMEGPCFPPSIQIEANLVSSQIEIHQPWGGVVPSLAKREHQKNLLPLLQKALSQTGQLFPKKVIFPLSKKTSLAKIFTKSEEWFSIILSFLQSYRPPNIDLIAVTQGPGLAPALWTGVNFAQALSSGWGIPLIPVNHLEAHLLSGWLPEKEKASPEPVFPLIALIVSGGHTQLVLANRFDHYQLLGETRDDAAGECFDKTARLLGLGYPGGPPIAQAAEKWQTIISQPGKKIPTAIENVSLPRPMIRAKNFDFSFAGLKTAVSYLHQRLPSAVKNSSFYPLKMADEIQQAINDVLLKKTIKAARDFRAKGIVLSGGVSANRQLRKRLAEKCRENHLLFFLPPLKFTMDNAAMIALTGYCHQSEAKILSRPPYLQAEASLSFTEKVVY